jgi:serine/threonine protein kinase
MLKTSFEAFTNEVLIGSGAYGEVLEVHEIATGKILAMKICSIENDNRFAIVQNEIEINTRLSHPNIPKFHGWFIEHHHEQDVVVLLFDLIKGKDLHYLTMPTSKHEIVHFSNYDVYEIMTKLLDLLEYIHGQGIIHRDIKLENIVVELDDKTFDKTVHLIDFGLAISMDNRGSSDYVGTIYYLSPEILCNAGSYDQKVDIWALGVVLVELLSGETPFYDDDLEAIRQYPDQLEYRAALYDPRIEDSIEPSARDLILHMLQVEPNQRATIAEIRASPWMLSH